MFMTSSRSQPAHDFHEESVKLEHFLRQKTKGDRGEDEESQGR
jgi:hypothetical protein